MFRWKIRKEKKGKERKGKGKEVKGRAGVKRVQGRSKIDKFIERPVQF